MTKNNYFFLQSKYYLLFPLMLAIGITLGVVLPANFITTFITPIADIAIRIVLYFTIPYFFFSLIIAVYELTHIKQLFLLLKTLFVGTLILYAGIIIISMVIFIFFPSKNLLPLAQAVEVVEPISVQTMLETLFPIHWLRVFSLSSVAPLLILSVIIGICISIALPHNHAVIEVISGLRKIIIASLHLIMPVFTIIIVTLTTHRIGTLKNIQFLSNFAEIIFMLIGIVLLLLCIIFPILFKVLRIPMYSKTWLKTMFPTIAMAFASGSLVASGALLLNVNLPKSPRRKIIDTSVSLSFIFGRIGVALVIVLSYIFLYKAFSVENMSILQLSIVFITSILLSWTTEIVTVPIITIGIASISRIETISIQELYTLIIPLVPILSGFAASIDVICCGFLQLFVKHRIIKTSPTPFPVAEQNDNL